MQESPLLRVFEVPVLHELLRYVKTVVSLQKETLINQSDPCTRMYILRAGSLQAAATERLMQQTQGDGGMTGGVTGGASVAQVRMAAGYVCFFYTHWLHRAPAPPTSAAEGSRLCLFGVFGKKASSEGWAAPFSGTTILMCLTLCVMCLL